MTNIQLENYRRLVASSVVVRPETNYFPRYAAWVTFFVVLGVSLALLVAK